MNMSSSNSTELPTAPDCPDYDWVSIPYYIEGALIITFNLITLLVFAVNGHLCQRSYYLVISLTTADMFVGGTVVAYAFVPSSVREFSCQLELTNVIVNWDSWISCASFWGLVWISVERMHATTWPFRHRNLSKRAYALAIALQWLLMGPLVVTFYNVLEFVNYMAVFATLSVTGLVIMCASYTSIYLKMRQQHQHHQQAALSRTYRRDRDLAKTLFIVTVISQMTWLPTAINLAFNLQLKQEVPTLIGNLFRFSNSMVNPVVYVFRMKQFRHALYKLLFKCSRDRPTHVGQA